MNDYLEKETNQLGEQKPQLLPSKSLLTTINLGYEIKQSELRPAQQINFRQSNSVITTMDTGFDENPKPIKPKPPINLGCDKPKEKNPDSIIDNIDTGFGCENQVVIDCPKPKFKTHLCKENYLGEFKAESEKALARNNLGVYSKKEIDEIVGKIIIDNKNFVTKKEVENMISDLDFVNSTLRSYADYQIPNDLFKL